MKRILLTLVILAGCASGGPSVIEGKTDVVGIDLRPFTEQGFLFTPNSYVGEYDPVGIVAVTVWPRAEKIQRTANGGTYNVWQVETVNVTEALDKARDEAISLGADALTNLEVRHQERVLSAGLNSASYVGVEIRGFAIRRK